MGTTQSKTYKINYEDMIIVIKKNECIINTLLPDEQDCLIKNTINYKLEEKFINDNIKNLSRNIIIYGKNSNDETVHKKYTQLIQLGFANVFIYTGGMFEWLCLQDIYGSDEFPTTSRELDILKYKALSQFSNNELLTN
jgi:hypothetical protein|tara:strand:- start:68 stop:484 length:417 start_codon:yes stop_codon:yes gene_type:complete